MWGLDGRTAIVTGGALGIGRSTALALGRAGMKVMIADVDGQAAEQVLAEACDDGLEIACCATDVRYADQVDRMVRRTQTMFGSVDVLFANAAVQFEGPVGDTSEADWDRIQAVNARGIFLCCRAVLPVMLSQQKGSIVIAASGHAFATYPGFSAYAAAKGAVVAFMRGLALDYAANGIRANCVVPGATATRLIEDYFHSAPDPEKAKQDLLAKIPMRRLGTPEDVAKSVLFLASDHSSYITGASLAVDGGLMAHG